MEFNEVIAKNIRFKTQAGNFKQNNMTEKVNFSKKIKNI
jgi:hypothetical protein